MIRTSQLTTRPGAGLMLRVLRTTRLAVAVCLCFAPLAAAQSTSPASDSATADLTQQGKSLEGVAAQIHELRMALDAMREQLAASHNESEELRQELRTVREQLESLRRPSGQAARPPAAEPPTRDQLDALAEEQELLRAKVLGGTYPPGSAPKRATKVMQPMPQLANDIPALAEYLH